MKLDEIIAHNKANLERCTIKQATFMKESVPDLEPSDATNLFVTKRKVFSSKYTCSVLCWDKDTDECRCIHQFGFNNRNRLRNRIAALQKDEKDIVCRVISINKED